MSIFLRPTAGTYIQEIDLSATTTNTAFTAVAMVFPSDQGPLQPTYVTGSYQNWTNLYGPADPTTSYAHDTVYPILNNANAPIWALRVVNGATYAGRSYNQGNAATLANSWTTGPTLDYQSGGSPQQVVLWTSGPFVTSNSINLPITDMVGSLHTVTQAFSSTSDNTLALFAAAIQTQLNSISGITGAVATAIVNPATSGSSNTTIIVTLPYSTQVAFGAATITGGVSQPTITVDVDSKLFDIFAQNPGTWGNNLSVQVTNFDPGTFTNVNIVFSQALVTGNSFSATVNGTSIGPIVFSSNSNATMQAIATAISSVSGIASATVQNVAFSNTNNRTITVVSSASGPNTISITGAAVTSGASQPAITTAIVSNGIASTGTFDVNVYLSPNLNTPIETFKVTLTNTTDGVGNQLNIATNINTTSKYIRVYQPIWAQSLTITTTSVNGVLVVDSSMFSLSGGTNGAAVTTGQLVNSLSSLSNRFQYPFNIICDGGYTDPVLMQAITNLAASRQDSFAIGSVPSVYNTSASIASYRQNVLNISSSYGAVYCPNIQYVDPTTDAIRFIPPTGEVVKTFVNNDSINGIGHAPAGMQYPITTTALAQTFNSGDTDLLTQNQVNFIIPRHGAFVIWNDSTLQSSYSSISHVSVRRIVTLIETTVADSIDYETFENNDDTTRFKIASIAQSVVTPLIGNGLYSATIVCDASNNTANVIAAGQLICDVYMDPEIPAKRLLLRGIIEATGANFTLLESAISSGNYTNT